MKKRKDSKDWKNNIIETFNKVSFNIIIIVILLLSIAPLMFFLFCQVSDAKLVSLYRFFSDTNIKDYYILFCSVLPVWFAAIATIVVNKNNMELAKTNYQNSMRSEKFAFITIQCITKKESKLIEMKLKNASNNIANNIKISNKKICEILCGLQEFKVLATYDKKDKIDKTIKNDVIKLSENSFPRNKDNIPGILKLDYYDSLNNHLKVSYEYINKSYIIRNIEYDN